MNHSEPSIPEPQEKGREEAEEAPPLSDDPAFLRRKEVRQGLFPGQERVRFVYPSHTSLQRIETSRLKATPATLSPTSGVSRVIYRAKRLLIGAPLANEQASHERLTKIKALAVLSSDVISSVAYATEAGMASLIVAGSAALISIAPITLAIIALLAIVTLSYSQTIPAYPNGGGSYIVAKDNLGTLAGLVAAAALLVDYVLTVSVSVTSGVQNLAVYFTALQPFIVPLDVLLIAFIALINLRGIRESGTIFTLPTYFFVGTAFLMILMGLFKSYVLYHNPFIGQFPHVAGIEPLTLFLVLKSFASGCSAITGTEAISNGVPAFTKPEARNARLTLISVGFLLAALFVGITLLTLSYGIVPDPTGATTVIGTIAKRTFTGPFRFLFPVFQISVLLILTLAANTSFADFPRLSSLLARDHFLPHQFAFRGDRLAFSTGIIFLAILASLLDVAFGGNTIHLIDLYAVGVFISFTLSQAGMVMHWWRLRGQQNHWLRSMLINGLGAFTTLLVATVITFSKFLLGAWVVVLLIPLLVLMFLGIHRHYLRVERERTTNLPTRSAAIQHLFVVPIAGLDQVSVQSLAYAHSIAKRVIAVHIAIDEEDARLVQEAWNHWTKQIPDEQKGELVIIDSPYRSLNAPLLAYIDTVHELYPEVTLTVLLPEFVVAHWWEHLLHNQTALHLKAALLFRPGIVVTNMPQHLSGGPDA